ncbi:hypothetical protein KC333_g2 [Hortaea werneckii]|nr:hypothetical protein KC333_g2 [Hortaea werneckii]
MDTVGKGTGTGDMGKDGAGRGSLPKVWVSEWNYEGMGQDFAFAQALQGIGRIPKLEKFREKEKKEGQNGVLTRTEKLTVYLQSWKCSACAMLCNVFISISMSPFPNPLGSSR